ncbi:MAB_1171c family putative transporter [Streptomyces roseus]|uniref:MAB_1171c family putative transporter n=1 Tax=Streptomyces roseus TaxID=66430 RepID=UPI0037F7CD50
MQQLLHPLCLTLAVAGFSLLLRPARRHRRDTALTALAGVYGFCALSFLVSLEPTWIHLGEVTNSHSIALLASFACVIAQISLQPVVLACWILPPDAARRAARTSLLAGAAVIAGLVLLFALLPTTGPTTPQTFTARHLGVGVYQAYLGLYISAYGAGQALLVVGCLRAARRTGEVWVARGLRIVGAGALLTLGYCAIRLTALLAAVRGDARIPAAVEHLAWACADGGTLMVLTGFLVPALGVHLVPGVRGWLRAQQQYRTLGPLWEVMHRSMPAIALQPGRRPTRVNLPVWDVGWQLYRRCVEIRDGQWALAVHLEPAVREASGTRHRGHGLRDGELAAAITADQLHAALAARHGGRRPAVPAAYADSVRHPDLRTPEDDVRELLRIAAHFTAAAQPSRPH